MYIYAACDFACFAIEPTRFEDAVTKEEWVKVMEEEIVAINKNQTWILADLTAGKGSIGLKWIFKSKFNPDGSLKKNKGQLVVKGYAQVPGTDFSEPFAPVACLDTIRIVPSVAAFNGWSIYQLDVKSSFLNGE